MILEPLAGRLDLDRIIDGAELQAGLLLEGARVDLLVPDELHVTDERTLDDDEGDLHASFEVFGAHLHVVEEAEGEDRAEIVTEPRGGELRADRALDPAEDHRLLHPAVAFDGDVFDQDRRRLGLRRRDRRHERHERKKNGETRSPRPGQRNGLV